MRLFFNYKKTGPFDFFNEYIALREGQASSEEWKRVRRKHTRKLRFCCTAVITLYLFMHAFNAEGYLLLFLDIIFCGGILFWWWLSRYAYISIRYGIEASIKVIKTDVGVSISGFRLKLPHTHFQVKYLNEEQFFEGFLNFRLQLNDTIRAYYIPGVHYFFPIPNLSK